MKIIFLLLIICLPIYNVFYWYSINNLPSFFISNTIEQSHSDLSIQLKLIGFAISLFPLSVMIYGLNELRKLFSFYEKGIVFFTKQVKIFKNVAKSLFAWIIFSIIYGSAQSVIFSINNAVGNRELTITFTSDQVFLIILSLLILLISLIMDEGRNLSEENKLTI